MSEFPLISIIIPVYNRTKWLTRCLESIRSQEYKNYEIILVDDCSIEDLKEPSSLCDRYIRNNINMGPSYSKDLGALDSKGEILLFLDSDTELLPDSLKNLPRIFNSDPLIKAIGGAGPPNKTTTDVEYIRLIFYSPYGRKIIKKCYPSQEPSKTKLYDVDIAASAFLAVLKDAFFLIGGFDPYFYYLGEDRDLCFNLKEHGYRVVVSPDTRAMHLSLIEGNDKKSGTAREWHIFLHAKYLEVALKRKGVFWGIIWMASNYRDTVRIVFLLPFLSVFQFLLPFLKVFQKYKDLARRRKIKNYLIPKQMDDYRLSQLRNHLKKHLPFPARFPLRAPNNIMLFVTSRCNKLCDHCFIDGVPKGKIEISADNIVKLVSSLRRPTALNLTGGEPFLRDDLEIILHRLMALKQTFSICIMTNGSSPEKIESVCKNICGSYKKPLFIHTSLDGLEKTHDLIRKSPGGFQETVETCGRLKSIARANRNFSFCVSTLITKSNLAEIEEVVEYMEKHQIPSILSVVRGNSFSTFNVPSALLNPRYNPRRDVAAATDEIRRTLEAVKQKHPAYFDALQKNKLKITLDTLDLKKRQIPCYAGFEDSVIYSNGDIALCEQIISFGNLADWDWDFLKALNSKEAMEHRVQLLSCACIHGCNIRTSIIKRGLLK